MSGKNKYSCRSKISAAKVRQIVKLFAIDLTATQIAQVTGLNRNTVNTAISLLFVKESLYSARLKRQ